MTDPAQAAPDGRTTVFTQPPGQVSKGKVIMGGAALATLALAVFSLVNREGPLVVAFFLVLSAAATWLVVRSGGGLRCEITPEAIRYEQGSTIRRDEVESVLVAHLRSGGELVVRRRGHRLRRSYGLSRLDPGAFAEALRRAGWPVSEER